MNTIEIIGTIGSVASMIGLLAFKNDIHAYWSSIRCPRSIDDYLLSLNVRDKCRIAIVDDEIDDFPISYLTNSGYQVETFTSLELSDFRRLLKFDMVFLDVQGVVKSDYEYGGAKLIKLIKDERPLLPVIAVSSGRFKTSLTNFFELSYDRINKPIEELRIKAVVDDVLVDTFFIKDMSNSIHELISCSKVKSEKDLVKHIVKYFDGKLSVCEFEEFIHCNTPYKYSEKIINKCKVLKERINND